MPVDPGICTEACMVSQIISLADTFGPVGDTFCASADVAMRELLALSQLQALTQSDGGESMINECNDFPKLSDVRANPSIASDWIAHLIGVWNTTVAASE